MNKFSKSEVKTLDYITKHLGAGNVDKRVMLKWLRDTLGFDTEESIKFYKLWFLNKSKKAAINTGESKWRVPWETIEEVNRGDELVKFIKRVEENDGDVDEVLEVYYPNEEDNNLLSTLMGPDFKYCTNYGRSLPCIEFEEDGLEIAGDSHSFESFISGVGDQAWRINDDGEHSEDYDTEEFNYAMYDDKTLEILKKMGDILGIYIDDPKYGGISDGGLNNYLEDNLSENDYDDIVNEYIWSLNAESGRYRAQQVREIYENEITYEPYYSSNGPHAIKIPYEDLIEKIEKHNIITLSELQELEEELNPCDGCDLDDAWWGVDFIDDAGQENVFYSLNSELERKLDKLEEDEDYVKKTKLKREFLEFIKKNGFRNTGWAIPKWVSNDGKLEFLEKDLNVGEKMITFTYNGEKHKTSLEDFIPWVQGSILDLKESVTISKFRLIMESISTPEEITKIAIFDFDGTLMDTPHPDTGKDIYKSKTGMDYPHLGWWSKEESLDTDIFDIKPITSTILDYNIEKDNPSTMMVMLTGRLPKQSNQVESILHDNDLIFDEYHYKDLGDTLKSKLNTIQSLLNRFPNVSSIEMYEDREPHAIAFEEWGKENNIPIKVNLVKLI